jgi:hypothetical protein
MGKRCTVCNFVAHMLPACNGCKAVISLSAELLEDSTHFSRSPRKILSYSDVYILRSV